MKKIIITGEPSSICTISACDEIYLKQASCPVLINQSDGYVSFEWDDSLKTADDTPVEHLCPRPVDRIMDTITTVMFISEDNHKSLYYKMCNMGPGETLEFDANRCLYGHLETPADSDGDMHWTVLKSGLNVFDVLKEVKKEDNVRGYKLAARLGDKIITKKDIEDSVVTASEMLNENWELIALTRDSSKNSEYIKTHEIRILLKKTNFLGIKHDEIDKMSIDDIWEQMMSHHFSDEKKYLILKSILEINN